MRKLLSTILIVLAPTAGLLLIAAHVVGSSAWVHERVRDAIARQLADTTGRQVRIGPVSGSLLSDIHVHGLAVAAEDGMSVDDGAVVSARDIHINLSLLDVVRGDTAPAASVSRIRIDGLHADIQRRVDGRLNISDLIPEPGPPAPPEEQFAGHITITDARVRYTDETLLQTGEPLSLSLDELEVIVDMRDRDRMVVSVDGDNAGGPLGRLCAQMTFRHDTNEFAIDADIAALQLGWAHGRFWPDGGVVVRDGSARVRASVVRSAGGSDAELGYYAHVDLRPTTVLLHELTAHSVRAWGELWVTPGGVFTDRLNAVWAGSDIVVDGGLADYAEPAVDLHLRTPALNVDAALAALPAEVRDRIPDFALRGPVMLDAAISGSLKHAGGQATISLPDALSVRPDDAVTVTGHDVEFTVSLMDLSAPAGCAKLNIDTLDPGRIALASPRRDVGTVSEQPGGGPGTPSDEPTDGVRDGRRWPDGIFIEPLRDVEIAARWAGDIAEAKTSISARSLRADDVEVKDLTADVTFVDDTVHLGNLRAEVLGAEVAAEVVVDPGARPVGIYAGGLVSGLDLERLASVPFAGLDLPHKPSGRVDAEFGLQYVAGELSSAATVVGESIEYERWGVLRSGALLSQQGPTIDVRTAFAADAIGTLWARGEVMLPSAGGAGELSLEYQAAEVKLDELAGRLDHDGLEGILYARGTIDGRFDDPAVRADATLFAPAYGGYGANAATASAELRDGRLLVWDLMARRGTAAFAGEAAIAGLPSLVRMGTEGALDDAALSGEFSGAGIQLADVAQLLDADEEQFDGLAELSGVIGGTLADPLVAGELRVAHALTSTANVSEGLLPFSLRNRVLTVKRASLVAHGSQLVVDARVDFSEAEPVLSAELSAADVHLEGIHTLQERGWDLAGLVQIPRAHVHGPFDALAGEALVVSEHLQIGNEPVENLRAVISLDDETVRVTDLTALIAHGGLSGTGEYTHEDGVFAATASVDGADLSRLIASIIPFVNATHGAEDSEQKRTDLVNTLNSYSLRLGGLLKLDIDAGGTVQKPAGRAVLTVTDTVFEGERMPDISARADVDAEGVHGLDLEATMGEMLITASGEIDYDGELDLIVQGSGVRVEHFNKWIPLGTQFAGELGFTLVGSGPTGGPNLMGSVDVFEPGIAGVRLDLISAPIVSVKEGSIDIDTLIVRHKRMEDERWVTEAIELDGSIPFSWDPIGIVSEMPMRVGASIDKTSLALAPALINEYMSGRGGDGSRSAVWSQLTAEGSIQSDMTISGTPAQPIVTGNLVISDGAVAIGDDEPLVHDASVDIEVKGDGRTNTVYVNNVLAMIDETSVSLGGTAELTSLSPDSLQQNLYDLALQIGSDGQAIGSGFIAKDLRGTVALRGGGGEPPTVYVDQLGASLGRGHIFLDGTMELESFRFADLAGNRTDLALIADNSRIWSRGILDAVVDGAIRIAGPGAGVPVDVTGLWTISNGRFGIPPSGEGAEAVIHAPGSGYPKPNFDVRIAFGPEMTFAASGVRAPLRETTPVHLTGTLQRPVLTGQIEAQAGKTQIPGGVATIQTLGARYKLAPAEGRIRRDPVELSIDGDVWGLAETVLQSAMVHGREIGPVTISITLSGTLPDQFEIRADSRPALAQEQIYALLGAAPLGYFAGGGGQTDIASVLSEQFLGALAAGFKVAIFEPIEQDLRRTLGLSELTLNFAFNQPVEIRMGKYLMEDLLVSYRTAFGGGEDYDLTVSYVLGKRTRVSYTTDERDRHRIQIERVWDF